MCNGSWRRLARIGSCRCGRTAFGVPHQEITGDIEWVGAVALGSVDGREVIVSGHGLDDGTVRVWDARTRQLIDEPLIGDGPVIAVALGSVGGREVIVSGNFTKMVRIWAYGDTHSIITMDVLMPVEALGLTHQREL